MVRCHGCAPWERLDGVTTSFFSTDDAFATLEATAVSEDVGAEYEPRATCTGLCAPSPSLFLSFLVETVGAPPRLAPVCYLSMTGIVIPLLQTGVVTAT